ncbi:glucosaminidase domain-containing protein [Thiomicrorhabdus sp. ZW0627]|uniref:glucosaminidase domain-containing protein n=1 Tax=Thiomicrorhabdus sp. ZW0627 TaxID=3039774 RepID=UPI002436483E|nr:glucosaminidase domain-containing protein [Thiomicrorhabdus sp. ZW0627]MDG6773044.1 glucosaminidase domain-containing protein [Thiomicrorhabdus sp. ZW0627]
MLQTWTLRTLIPFLFFPFICLAESSTKISASIATPDFANIKDVKLKKQLFFEYLTPYIQQANEAILKERAFIQSLNFNRLNKKQRKEVRLLMQKYRIEPQYLTQQTQETLLKRIDIIPNSMALAQAANESSWGTSRFAIQANNYFGQWCFKKGCGLVPLRRPEGQYHEVKKFASPLESVQSYMLMLNNRPAFKTLRDLRQQARKANNSVNGILLAQGLESYSALKARYVEIISSMIRTNQLAPLDG